MFPLFLIAAWVCIATLFGAYGGFRYRTHTLPPEAQASENHFQSVDLKVITVPVIRQGQIKGYVSAEFSITGQLPKSSDDSRNIESYVLDEAYRLIYADVDIDFDYIEKTDLNRLTSNLRSRVNTRLEKDTVTDVLVRGFHYVPREEVMK